MNINDIGIFFCCFFLWENKNSCDEVPFSSCGVIYCNIFRFGYCYKCNQPKISSTLYTSHEINSKLFIIIDIIYETFYFWERCIEWVYWWMLFWLLNLLPWLLSMLDETVKVTASFYSFYQFAKTVIFAS